MSTITRSHSMESPNLSDWIPSPLFRMTLERYEQMVASGAFTEHDRVHLINGFLVAKMTQGDPHCVSDDRQIEVYSGPSPTGYRSRVDFLEGQNVTVLIEGVAVGQIAVADILP
jgi:hypothetical protein